MSRVEKSCIQRFSLRHGIALNYLEFCSGRNRKKKDDSRIEAWRLRNASSQRKSAADVCSSHPVFRGKGWKQWCHTPLYPTCDRLLFSCWLCGVIQQNDNFTCRGCQCHCKSHCVIFFPIECASGINALLLRMLPKLNNHDWHVAAWLGIHDLTFVGLCSFCLFCLSVLFFFLTCFFCIFLSWFFCLFLLFCKNKPTLLGQSFLLRKAAHIQMRWPLLHQPSGSCWWVQGPMEQPAPGFAAKLISVVWHQMQFLGLGEPLWQLLTQITRKHVPRRRGACLRAWRQTADDGHKLNIYFLASCLGHFTTLARWSRTYGFKMC